MPTDRTPPAESLTSLAAFWLVAFAAAALFAAVLIAPKWERHDFLVERVRQLTKQCEHVSDQAEHLERVIDALKHDPDFTAEMARYELDYGLPDEQRLPAPAASPPRRRDESAAAPPESCWQPYVRLFARDAIVRLTALVTAAVFVVVGLAFFNSPREKPTAELPLSQAPRELLS